MTIPEKEKIIIDAVILWVDGTEEKHKNKILPYVENKESVHERRFRTRYDQVDEIKFTIDSIIKFAPFVRKIHIITDDQKPNFLKNKDTIEDYAKVNIIDHKVVFNNYQNYLPTFNCRSIETCMHRIPELSEHFIYFNDDFFLINPTKSTDFFRNEMPVLRGKWLKFDENIFYKKFRKIKFGHKSAQQKAARLIGLNKYYNFKHTPHPLRKSTFESYFKSNPEVFLENISYKFRNSNQFTPQGLANHIEIKNNTCTLKKDLQLMYYRSFKKPLFWYIFKFKNVPNDILFLGLQSLDKCPPKILKFLLNWLKKRTFKD